jgi:hypothetical protein
LKEVIAGARPKLSHREAQVLEEFIANYQDVFETKSGDHGRTEKVYHRIDTGDAQPIRQPPHRLPSAKHAEVNDMLEDMNSKGVIEESRQSLVLACGACSEERRQPSLLRRLQKTE